MLQAGHIAVYKRDTSHQALRPTYTYQLQHVLVVQAAVDADLSVDLVVVELRQLAAVVNLDRHLSTSSLADRQVHCGSVATAQLFRNDELVNAPAMNRDQAGLGVLVLWGVPQGGPGKSGPCCMYSSLQRVMDVFIN